MSKFRNEFIDELELAGATHIDYATCQGCDEHDSLSFELNNKLFYITTLRGGSIIGGSFMQLCVMDTLDYSESNTTWTAEQWAEYANKVYSKSLNRMVEEINENNKLLGQPEIQIVKKVKGKEV